MNTTSEQEILTNAYQVAESLDLSTISPVVKQDVDVLIEKIDSNKSLVSALVTSLLKKIAQPSQDVRLHRADFEHGYSARVLDTQVTSPFFKDYFPKYANKESSFLTLATREKIKWTKTEGEDLKIRDKKLKTAFLNIFEQIEVYNANPVDYLHCIFAQLIHLSAEEKALFEATQAQTQHVGKLNIDLIIKMLVSHFDS